MNAHAWRRWAVERGLVLVRGYRGKYYEIVGTTVKILMPAPYRIRVGKIVKARNKKIFKKYLLLKKKGFGAGMIYELLSEQLWYCGTSRGTLTPDSIKRIIYSQKYARGEKKRNYVWRNKKVPHVS